MREMRRFEYSKPRDHSLTGLRKNSQATETMACATDCSLTVVAQLSSRTISQARSYNMLVSLLQPRKRMPRSRQNFAC